jgi:hypothetical protein
MARARNTKLWFFQLLALSLSMLFVAACVEVFVRLSGVDPPLMWRPDPEIGWRHIPGASAHWTEEGDAYVKINTLGLRDVERTVSKPVGVFRIAVFGDSMTEGVQVNLDQTYTQVLERGLRKRGLNIEVLNFGVNGFSPLQGYLFYERAGKRFQPDLVLHAVFTDNDIADCDPKLAAGQVEAPFAQQNDSGNLIVDVSAPERSTFEYEREPNHTIRRLSATYRFLGVRRRRRAAVQTTQATLGSTGGIPKRQLVYRDPSPGEWESAWRVYEKILAAFAADVKSNGGRFAVISVPAGQVVDREVWNRLLGEYPAMAELQWNLRGPEERLRALALKHDVPLIQPLSDFQAHLGGSPMFFNGSGPATQNGMGHMTPQGHEVMAIALEQQLDSQHLIPSADRTR